MVVFSKDIHLHINANFHDVTSSLTFLEEDSDYFSTNFRCIMVHFVTQTLLEECIELVFSNIFLKISD